jgi:hypothetical protein
MSNILKGLNESYSRDEENQQNAMDARRSSDLSRERNAGLNEPDEFSSEPRQTRNGVYEYNVPAGQEDIAKDLGLQHHRGHWVSRIPIQRANFQFGRPQFHEIPAKGVAEGLLNELFDHQQEYFKLADGQVIRVDYRQSGLNPDGMPGTIKIVSVNPKIMPMSGMQAIQPWDKARQNIRMAIQKWVQSGQQGVAEGSNELYGLRVGDTVKAVINGKRVQGDVIDIFPDSMEVELLLRGANAGRTITVDVRDTESMMEDSALDRRRNKLGADGYISTASDRLRDQELRRQEREQNFQRNQAQSDASADTMINWERNRQQADDARTRHEIDVLAHRLNRMQRDDDDWERTFDMMRDRINRYQYSTQRDVDPEQLAAITNIQYQPRRKKSDFVPVDESSDSNTNQKPLTDAKGRTSQQWLDLVNKNYPNAQISQEKGPWGKIYAKLPDGRKLVWAPNVQRPANPGPARMWQPSVDNRNQKPLTNAEGLTSGQWENQVMKQFPDAVISREKGPFGKVYAKLSDGRKLVWAPVIPDSIKAESTKGIAEKSPYDFIKPGAIVKFGMWNKPQEHRTGQVVKMADGIVTVTIDGGKTVDLYLGNKSLSISPVSADQQGIAEGSKEQEYGPEWDEKIKRLGQMAKQGERKTVWDPVKRVYKTVPVQQSAIKEGLDELDENLNQWFKEKWVRFGPDGKIRGDCARGDDSEGKPKCLPQSKAQNLGKKGRASAAARKRREDPNPERSGKAINVNTKKKSNEGVAEGLPQTLRKVVPGYAKREIDRKMDAGKFGKTDADKDANFQRYKKIQDKLKEQGVAEEQLDELKCWDGYTRVQGVPAGAPGSCKKKTNEEEHNEKCPECGGPMFSDLLLAEKKDACYNKVRSRYKVWPSAYASGALVQCRKKGAANWGTGGKKNESVEEGIDPNNPWGDQGRFAGDVKHDISTTIKYPKWQIGLPVFVKHIGQKGMIDSLYSDSAIVGVGGRQYRVPLGGLKRYPINEAELDEGQIYAGGNKPAGMRKYEPRTVPSQAELSKKESAIMKGLQLEGNDEEYHTGGSLGTPYPGTYEQETLPYRTKGQRRTLPIAFEDTQLDEKWSDKYKSSIDCSNPKGFSQKAHCQGRKK